MRDEDGCLAQKVRHTAHMHCWLNVVWLLTPLWGRARMNKNFAGYMLDASSKIMPDTIPPTPWEHLL